MNRDFYNEDGWSFIESHRQTFDEIDKRMQQIDKLRSEIAGLCSVLGEWVIRRRWIRDVQWHGGSLPEGHVKYYCRATEFNGDGFVARSSDHPSVLVLKSPRDAEFILECLHPNRTRNRGKDYVDEIVRRS